jgi:hypothetical protein
MHYYCHIVSEKVLGMSTANLPSLRFIDNYLNICRAPWLSHNVSPMSGTGVSTSVARRNSTGNGRNTDIHHIGGITSQRGGNSNDKEKKKEKQRDKLGGVVEPVTGAGGAMTSAFQGEEDRLNGEPLTTLYNSNSLPYSGDKNGRINQLPTPRVDEYSKKK